MPCFGLFFCRFLPPPPPTLLFPCASRGFNEAINCFPDDGWVSVPGDGRDDVTVAARPATNSTQDGSGGAGAGGGKGGVLCAKASMLLQVREGGGRRSLGSRFRV